MVFLQLHGEAEREDGPFMRPLSVGTIARCGQREDGQLKGGILRDTQPPIRAEAVEGRIFQVPLNDSQEVRDLLPAHAVLNQPTISQPVAQAHCGHR